MKFYMEKADWPGLEPKLPSLFLLNFVGCGRGQITNASAEFHAGTCMQIPRNETRSKALTGL